ncbi:Universal stress protein A [Salmonella enterica subsp. enterica]|nr:Universal stress protein A [Salmonella enterica subsp. enterica]
MSYTHILVAVAVTPESHQLLAKAVSIARPVQAKVSLITLASDPELYNQFAAPMMEDLRAVMHEETENFLKMLGEKADYPIEQTFIASGELSQHILAVCRKHHVDLVICGNP